MEYRRRCNVCGKIYCYSDQDLKENTTNSAMAAVSAIGSLAAIFGGGTRLDSYALSSRTDRYNDKVVDYNKCPNCNSSNTSLITNDEWIALQQKETPTIQNPVVQTKKIDININATPESLLKRTKMFLEEEDWDSASVYCEQILDIDPECSLAYLFKLMIQLRVTSPDKLALLPEPFSEDKNYQKALRFADDPLRRILEGYNNAIVERNTERAYSLAMDVFRAAKNENDYKTLIPRFRALGSYKDSSQMVDECEEKAKQCKYDNAIMLLQVAKTEDDYLKAKDEFDSLGSFLDAATLSETCKDNAESARKNAIYDVAVSDASSNTIKTVMNAINAFEKISGWRDADRKKIEALEKVDQLQKAEKKAAKRIKTVVIVSITAIIVCVAIVMATILIAKSKKYDSAQKAYISGDYITAINLWSELENFKDSQDRIQDSAKQIYDEAKELIERGEYDAAINKLNSIASYLSIEEDKGYCYYMIALAHAKNGDYTYALTKLSEASSYAKGWTLKGFCENALELQSINDGAEHNLRVLYEAISTQASDQGIDPSSLLNTEYFNIMLSLNGEWYETVKGGRNEEKDTISFDNGLIHEHTGSSGFDFLKDLKYKGGKYYIKNAGEKEYDLIKDYSGAGDNSFTVEHVFYIDDKRHDYTTSLTRR